MIRFIFLLLLLSVPVLYSVHAQYYGSQGPNPPIPVGVSPAYMDVDAKINLIWPREGDVISSTQQLPPSMIVRYDVSSVPKGGNYAYEQYHPYNRICIFPVVDGKIYDVRMYGGFVGVYFTEFPSYGGEYPYSECYTRTPATEAQTVVLPLPRLPDGNHTYGAMVYVGLNPGETPYFSSNSFLRNCLSCIGAFYADTQFYLATYSDISSTVNVRTGPPPPTVNISATPSAVVSGASSNLVWSTNNVEECFTSGTWSGYTIPKNAYALSNRTTGPLTAPATYTLACVSPEGLWATSTASVGIVNENYPDLIGLTPVISSTRAGSSGQFLTFAATIKNNGKIASSGVLPNVLRLDRSNDGSWQGARTNTRVPAPFGGEETFYFETTTQYGPGTHSAVLCADSIQTQNNGSDFSSITESDETNNCSEKLVFTITAAPEPVRIDGVCGSLDGVSTTTFKTDLSGGMCITGASSTVSNQVGPWNWSCTGSAGGVNASCSASIAASVPDLVSSNLTISSANPTAGVPMTLRARVQNLGGVDAGAFSDNFSYRWGTGSFINLNPFISHSGLSTGANAQDTYNFTPDRGGDLYIQHCVDSYNEVDEGANETPNCSVIGPYTVTGPVGDCIAQTIAHCSLTQTAPSTNADGTCTSGYVGSCRYACEATGSWNNTPISNSCTLLIGDLTVTPDSDPSDPDVDVPTNDTVEVAWNTNATTDCTISGLPGGETWSNLPADSLAPRTTRGVTDDGIIALVCDGETLDLVPITEVPPPNTVDISANRIFIDPKKDPEVTLFWRTPIPEDQCTIAGPGINTSPTSPLQDDPNTGSYDVTISARTTYTIDCQGVKDKVTIEVSSENYEQ